MRKLFIFLLAATLFTGCKDKKTTDNTTIQEKDDKDKKEDGDTQTTTDPGNNNDNNANYNSNWTDSQAETFVSNCITETVSGGFTNEQAKTYCSCMLQTLERKYPDPAEASRLTKEDLESPEMKKMVEDCLKH